MAQRTAALGFTTHAAVAFTTAVARASAFQPESRFLPGERSPGEGIAVRPLRGALS